VLSILNILFLFVLGINNRTDSNINTYLSEKLSDYKRFNYEIVSPKNIDISKIRFDPSRNFKINSNYAYLPIQIYSKKGKTKNSVITIRLELFKDVLVANRRISKNEQLSRSDFQIIEKEISTLRHEPLSILKVVNNFRAKLNIASQSILQNSMIEKIPDINLGDRVNAIYSKGIVNVQFLVVARSEGVIGDIINVKREDKKMFRARILNNTKVKIVE